jgi:hypothetical protein
MHCNQAMQPICGHESFRKTTSRSLGWCRRVTATCHHNNRRGLNMSAYQVVIIFSMQMHLQGAAKLCCASRLGQGGTLAVHCISLPRAHQGKACAGFQNQRMVCTGKAFGHSGGDLRIARWWRNQRDTDAQPRRCEQT